VFLVPLVIASTGDAAGRVGTKRDWVLCADAHSCRAAVLKDHGKARQPSQS
jgi:hypothetical protein